MAPTDVIPTTAQVPLEHSLMVSLQQMPMKIDTAFEPPPGLDLPASKVVQLEPAVDQGFKENTGTTATTATLDGFSIPDEYSLGEEVLALRSDGSWTPATVKRILDDKLVVAMKDGKKNIRKDMMHFLLKKVEKTSQPLLTEELLASQNAALEAENARLLRENMMINQNVALEAQNARLMQENAMMRMQSQMRSQPQSMHDPHGYRRNPWGIPQAACPYVPEDDVKKKEGLGSKLMSKLGLKVDDTLKKKMAADEAKSTQKKKTIRSLGSVSTTSCRTMSLGQSSTGVPSLGQTSSMGQSDAGDCEELLNNALADTLPHERTTVMMRNIPNNVTREQLLGIFNDEGFKGHYDLVYVPIDLKNRVGLGYAFINFVSNESAESFSEHFQGFRNWKMQSEKVCEVSWSDALQGLDEHVERYRDCPVMHESIPDELKPVLFKDGERVPFPEPTKRIRAPRPWSRRH